jgi:hypothetical protein
VKTQKRSFLAISLLLITSALAESPQIARAATKAACVFEAPLDWSAANVRWVGAYAQGRAHGHGVLRHLKHGAADKVFYGRFEKGFPVLGVIDVKDSGYIAGRYVAGKFDLSGDSRAVLVAALEEAEKAAKATARKFEKEGNRASAKYYRDKAKQWSEEAP